MERPVKKDYTTCNQMEYSELLQKYYLELEKYCDSLEERTKVFVRGEEIQQVQKPSVTAEKFMEESREEPIYCNTQVMCPRLLRNEYPDNFVKLIFTCTKYDKELDHKNHKIRPCPQCNGVHKDKVREDEN